MTYFAVFAMGTDVFQSVCFQREAHMHLLVRRALWIRLNAPDILYKNIMQLT